jgi:hypothetical protein
MIRQFNVHFDAAEGWSVNGPYDALSLHLVLAGLRLIRETIVALHGNQCAICHKPVNVETLQPFVRTIGHKVAPKDGGGDEIENRQLEHYQCNRQRHHVPRTLKPCLDCGAMHDAKYRRCDECKYAMTLLNAGVGCS